MAACDFQTTRKTFPAGKYYIGDHSLVTDDSYKLSSGNSFSLKIQKGNFSAETSLKTSKDFPGNIRIVKGRISVIPYDDLCVYEDDANEFGVVISSKKPICLTVIDGHFIIRSNQLFVYIDTNTLNTKDDFVYDKETHDSWKYEYDDEEDDDEDDEEDDDEEDDDEDDEEDDDEEDDEEEEEEEQ
jgi:hypothetical protein